MKFRFDKKYILWGVTLFLSLSAVILFYHMIFQSEKFFEFISQFLNAVMPIIFGLVMAYILSPVCSFIERCMEWGHKKIGQNPKDKKIKKRARTFAIIITMLLLIWMIYMFVSKVLGEVITSIQNIVAQSPVYISNMEELLNRFLSKNPDIEGFVNSMMTKYSKELTEWLNDTVLPQANAVVKQVSLSLIGVIKVLWNLIIGLIVSIYVLGSKEKFAGQAKKLIYALFKEKNANEFIEDIRYANKVFGSYISGKIIDSIIIGLICFLLMNIFRLPYTTLISLIVGFTNIIPFFGPFLGAIPSVLLILMVNPVDAIKFLVLILLLQQFDGNVLGPKILGDSTGLDSFWIIFSITLFGAYFGVLGMAIGVPIFALIYAAIKRKVNRSLAAKGVTTNTLEYMELDHMEEGKVIYLTEERKQNSRKTSKKESVIVKLVKKVLKRSDDNTDGEPDEKSDQK